LGSMHMAMDALFNVPFSAPVTTWTPEGGYAVGQIAEVPSASTLSIAIFGGPGTSSGGPFDFIGETGGSSGGGSNAQPLNLRQSLTRRQVACVAGVLARYASREGVTALKQQALTAGLGGAALLARFFFAHALAGKIAVGTFADMGIEFFVRGHSLGGGVTYGTAGVVAFIKWYPDLVKESFNNKREALRALRRCFD